MNAITSYVKYVAARIERHRKTSVFPTGGLPWDENLKTHFDNIRREFVALRTGDSFAPIQKISKEQYNLTNDEKWKVFFLIGYGYANPLARERCPLTTGLLRQVPGLISAFFSVLEPGKNIPPHFGKYNGILRYHLGLIIPEPNRCGLKVDGRNLHLHEGESLLFDDTFEHSAWNHGGRERAVLIIDLRRPLPPTIQLMNRLAIGLIRRSDYVQDARRKILGEPA